MKNQFVRLTLCLLCLSFASFARVADASGAAPGVTPLSSYLVQNTSRVQMDHIAGQFEVVKRLQNGFEVLVPLNQSLSFLSMAPQAKLLSSDIAAETQAVFARSRQRVSTGATNGYHSYQEVQQILKVVSEKHPDITQLVNYGKSQQGNPLLALRVSHHLDGSKPVKRVLLTAATHGDEIITTEVLLALMSEYVDSSVDGSNPRFAKLLEQLEVVFIPVVNADGFIQQRRYDNDSDPNRSYPYPDHADAKPTASIAAELKFIERFPITGSIDFHAYSALVMYPWGYTRTALEPAIQQAFDGLTSRMAKTNGYGHGQISDILYIAKGSSVDFFFWKYRTLALAIELGDSKSPSPSEFPKYIEDQRESTWMFLETFVQTFARR